MAALLERQEIGIKKTGSATTIPNSPVAKLMYYFDCVSSCVEAGDDSTFRRLRQYKTNYTSLSEEEEAMLLILCLALSPDKLIGEIFFPAEDLDKTNQFLELSAVSTKLVVSQSVLIGGQQKKVQKIMLFKKVWIERYYLEPLTAFTQRSRRAALPSPPRQQTRPVYNAPRQQTRPTYNTRPQSRPPAYQPSPRQPSSTSRRRNSSSCVIF